MKMRKNKGKIHPSPSSSPSSTPSNQNAISVLALLPAAILALIAVLSPEDKEVLAYMVTRSMNPVNPSPSPSAAEEKNKKKTKKLLLGSSGVHSLHRAPVFDCECFDCYTSYWFRWDSSPDKELIHKAIEEFEEFLFSQEQVKRSSSGKGRRRERGRREKAKEEEREGAFEESFDVGLLGNEALEIQVAAPAAVEEVVPVDGGEEYDVAAAAEGGASYNKGLVRKVLPDVVGLLNSRLWGLWSPNV